MKHENPFDNANIKKISAGIRVDCDNLIYESFEAGFFAAVELVQKMGASSVAKDLEKVWNGDGGLAKGQQT